MYDRQLTFEVLKQIQTADAPLLNLKRIISCLSGGFLYNGSVGLWQAGVR